MDRENKKILLIAASVIVFILILFIIPKINRAEERKIQAKIEAEKRINRKKFYYPKAYDKFWRTYKPNLVGAVGWIYKDCKKKKDSIAVIVKKQNLSIKRWGRCEGSLEVQIKENENVEKINYSCFIPNYKIGTWLR